MSELIWIGNTLYPRWFVFSVLAASICVVLGYWPRMAQKGPDPSFKRGQSEKMK